MKINRKWELLKEVDISPSPWFPLYKHTVKLPNGKIIDDYYLSKLGYVFVEPSKDTLKTHAFLVKDLEIKHSQKLEETEDIEVILIPINEIDKRIKSGEIVASDTIAVVRLTQLKYPDLF